MRSLAPAPLRLPRILIAGVLGGLFLLGASYSASGYIKQSPTRVNLSGPNVVRCDRAATITARVIVRKTGQPVANQIVRWNLARTQSSGDRLRSASSKTNRRGTTSVTVSFGPRAGPRAIRASMAGSSPTITVRCAGGLPRTATVPSAGDDEPASAAPYAPPLADGAASTEPLPATAIRMNRLSIDLPIVEGDGYGVPDGAAAHYPGTGWPGEGSNTYLYAHARKGHFLELWQVRTGDIVEVDMADGQVAEYRVSEIHPVVPWDALEYLAPSSEDVLTLQTCLTYEETAPRFVVIAERIHPA